MIRISLCMIVKNEEKVLDRCLASIFDPVSYTHLIVCVAEKEHFPALGAPCIKGVGIIIVYDVMRPVADSGEFLCGHINGFTAVVDVYKRQIFI